MVQQKELTKKQDLTLDEFLMMADVAATVKQKQAEVDRQLNLHEVREELKKKLQEIATVSGEKLTDFQIGSAINSYFEGLYSFKEPPRDFGTRLAEVYAERTRLAKKFGIPPLVAATIMGSVWLGAQVIQSARLKSEERSVENVVKIAYQERQRLLTETQEINSSPFVIQLPSTEKAKLQSQLSNSQERLNSMSPFFQKYCSDGTAEDDITRENFQEARSGLITIEGFIKKSGTEVQEGRSIIQIQEGLTLTRRNLESLIGEIRGLNPLGVFSQRAEKTYSSGLSEIERRNLGEAKQKEQELAGVKGDISQFFDLTSQTESLYGSLRTIAKEEEALQRGETLYHEAKQLAESADVQKLSQTVSQLQNLNNVLNQDYTIRIVSRSGVKSGIDRYYTDESGKRISGYYLIVEGLNSDGNPLQMEIRNEENGQTERVTMWGERIPQEVYERVKEDKLDNGIINDDVVGKKRKGYLKEEMTMKDVTKQGQITRW